ncbi:hypothetical protein GEMRC1_004808 [Eukaryota sp. GEM-RC1]
MSHEPPGLSDLDHYLMVVSSFIQYFDVSCSFLSQLTSDLCSIPQKHQDLIVKYKTKLEVIESCARTNGEFLTVVAKNGVTEEIRSKFQTALRGELFLSSDQHDKVNSTLKSLFREWSDGGDLERRQSFQPLLDAVITHFANDALEERSQRKVLVPGSGLGRLVYEFASLGFDTLGIEFSFFMILMSGFVLNSTTKDEYTIYPFSHSLSNVKSNSDILSPVTIPNVNTADFRGDGQGQMCVCAGDFVDVFGENEKEFDALATCFFMDTAQNVVEYVEIIHKILKDDGIWVNIGPLSYHWSREAGSVGFISIELSHEELMEVITSYGFKILKHEWRRCQYAQHPSSLRRNEYDCFYFEAVKQ